MYLFTALALPCWHNSAARARASCRPAVKNQNMFQWFVPYLSVTVIAHLRDPEWAGADRVAARDVLLLVFFTLALGTDELWQRSTQPYQPRILGCRLCDATQHTLSLRKVQVWSPCCGDAFWAVLLQGQQAVRAVIRIQTRL